MVLDEQSTSVPFEPDPPPTSSPDPYSSPASAIDFSRLPYGFHRFLSNEVRGTRDKLLRLHLESRAADVRRPLTPDETAALAYNTARVWAFTSYIPPVALVIGSLRAFATRKTYGNPIAGSMKRKGGFFDGERIQAMGIEICRGASARFLTHTIRFVNYNLTSLLLTGVFGAMFSDWSLYSGVKKDTRLKDFNADMKEMEKERRKERMKRLRELTTPRQAKSPVESGMEHRAALESEEARQDVGSSSAGSGGTEYAGNEGMVGGAGELRENDDRGFDFGEAKSDAPSKSQQTRPQPVSRVSPLANRTAAVRQPSTRSPEPEPDPNPLNWGREASDGGSAWERIRHGAGSSTAATASDNMKERRGARGAEGRQREQREGSGRWGGGSGSSSSSGGDDFSFSSSEQERSYAQEEAQRDFDARVEKERRGGEFSEGSGKGSDGRRWG